MLDQQQIRAAVDGVVQFFKAQPEKALSTDKPAVAVWQGGLRCHPQGPTPGWLLRAALANCDASMIALRAAQLGITLTRQEVTADSDSDDRGMFGIADGVPAGPLRVRVKVRLAAEGVPAEQLQALVEWAEQHSPVADALRRAVPLSASVEIG